MKVGDIFELPENVIRQEGRTGKIRNADETQIVGKYAVIKVGDEYKGKIIVTYHHKRKKHVTQDTPLVKSSLP